MNSHYPNEPLFHAGFDRSMRVAALDFDGTLWDSVHECYVLTLQAFDRLHWPVPVVDNLEDKFHRGRCFVKTGIDFFHLVKWIGEHPLRDPQTMTAEEEHRLCAPGDESEDSIFESTFYALRREWSANRFEEWRAMQRPFPGAIEELRALRKRVDRLVIATTKDADSVRLLLAPYGLAPEVIGKELSVDKQEQIKHIAVLFAVPRGDIVFVDDILDQVRRVMATGARAALAGWGYNTADQRNEAAGLGIPVLALDRFADSLVELFENR